MSKKKLKYPPEFKKEVCEHAKKESLISASLVYDVDRNTVSRWVKKYELNGISGFVTKKSKIDKNSNSKNKDQGHFLLQLKIVHQIVFKNEVNNLYQLIIYSNEGKILSVGFTKTRNSHNICLFIRYSFDKIRKKAKFRSASKVITRIPYLNHQEYCTIVKKTHNVELLITKDNISKKLFRSANYDSRDVQKIILESYKKIFENVDSLELEDSLLAPHINIDNLRFSKRSSVEWDMLALPAEDDKSLYKVLKDIKESGDKAILNYDYAKAKDIYDKVYIALMKSGGDNKKLQLEILLKKAQIQYDSDQFQVALMLYRDCMRFSNKNNFKKELGIAYYYLGMIYEMFHNLKGALRYLDYSENTLKELIEDDGKCIYYRTIVRKSLISLNFTEAAKLNKRYLKFAIKTKDKELIGNSLSSVGMVYYDNGDYKNAEKAFLNARQYNSNKRNYIEVSLDIRNLLNIYSYAIEKDYSFIELLLAELKIVSTKIKKPFISFGADFKLGIYYYNRAEYSIAEKLLYNSIEGNKKFSFKEQYISNLYYLGRVLYSSGKFRKAVRYLNLLVNEALSINNSHYVLYANRILAKVFFERRDYKRSLEKFNKTIKYAKRLNHDFITADSYKYLANLNYSKKYIHKAKYNFEQSLIYYNFFKKENSDYDISNEIAYIQEKLLEINAKIPPFFSSHRTIVKINAIKYHLNMFHVYLPFFSN